MFGERGVPGRGSVRCKGPGVGIALVCLRKSRKAPVTGAGRDQQGVGEIQGGTLKTTTGSGVLLSDRSQP